MKKSNMAETDFIGRKPAQPRRKVYACDAGIYEDVRAAEASGLSYGQYKIKKILTEKKKTKERRN